MRPVRFLVFALAMIAAGCARQSQPAYVMIDPATGQQIAVAQQPADPVPQPQYTAPQPMPQVPVPQPQYASPPPAPSPRSAPSDRARGLFTRAASPAPAAAGGPYVAAPVASGSTSYAYASAPAVTNEPYMLDAGDRLRVIVYGQEGIPNSYVVDAGGNITLPLIGSVPARGATTQQLAQMIGDRLKHGYVREPHVSVEVEQARPFFILGEVTTPGQYPYVANMSAETAIAIAGGFGPRASKSKVQLTRNLPGQQMRAEVPLNYPLRPGDTIVVKERWF